MNPLPHVLLIFSAILAAATLGVAGRRFLPTHHLNEETRTHYAATISIVATLAALVLGFATSNANTIRLTMLQGLTTLSSSIIRTGGMLAEYGPEAGPAHATLGRYATQKLQDLYPQISGQKPDQSNPAADKLLDELQIQIVTLHPTDDLQRFRQSQALEASNQIVSQQASIAEQRHARAPYQAVNAITLWLAIIFFSFGLFTPIHPTAFVAIALSGIAVSIAVLIILEARLPFDGIAPIPADSLREAATLVNR
jgi:hypothetical protein